MIRLSKVVFMLGGHRFLFSCRIWLSSGICGSIEGRGDFARAMSLGSRGSWRS